MPAETKSKRRRLMGEINVVPYIDVMLVLLVIFMVTAPLLTQGVKVELPRAATEPLPIQNKDEPPLVVSVDAQQQIFLSINADPEQAISLAALEDQVADALRADQARDVLIKADQRVPYGRVVTVMVALQTAGATRVGFLTDALPSAGRIHRTVTSP